MSILRNNKIGDVLPLYSSNKSACFFARDLLEIFHYLQGEQKYIFLSIPTLVSIRNMTLSYPYIHSKVYSVYIKYLNKE